MSRASILLSGLKKLTLPRWLLIFSALTIAVIASLFLWAQNPLGTQRWASIAVVTVAFTNVATLYVAYLIKLSRGLAHQQLSLRSTFLLMTVSALLCVTGYVLDALLIPILAVFTLVAEKLLLRLPGVVAIHPLPTVRIARYSAWLCVCYAVVSAVCGLSVTLLIPSATNAIHGWILPYAALVPTGLIGFMLIGDDARGWEMMLYGIPLGVPLTIALWAAAGAILGNAARFARYLLDRRNA